MYTDAIRNLEDFISEALDKQDTYEFLDTLRKQIEMNPMRFCQEMKDYIYSKCLINKICPKCFDELEVYKHKEPRNYGGADVYEVIHELVCNMCGTTY